MLILGLLNMVAFILNIVFGSVFALFPDISPEVTAIIENFMAVLDKGVDMFCFLLGPVASVLVAYILAFQIVKSTWDLIWFVIRKIPLLNIRE